MVNVDVKTIEHESTDPIDDSEKDGQERYQEQILRYETNRNAMVKKRR